MICQAATSLEAEVHCSIAGIRLIIGGLRRDAAVRGGLPINLGYFQRLEWLRGEFRVEQKDALRQSRQGTEGEM